MARPADGDHFNMRTNKNSRTTRNTSSWAKRWAKDDIAMETDASRIASRSSVGSTHHRDVEELLWTCTQAVAAPDVDFNRLSNLSLDQWEVGIGRHKYDQHEDLRTFSRQRSVPNIPPTSEVLVTGEIQCSVAEVAALLCCPGEGDYNSIMTKMHGHAFQRGCVVHNFSPAKGDNQDETDYMTPHRCVKMACFARPRLALLDTDERWCFLEEFAPVTQGRFTLSQRSLRPAGLPRAVRPPIELVRRGHGLGFTRSKKQIHQLQGLTMGYTIEAISARQPAAVRLIFYGCCSLDQSEGSAVAQKRMRRLARGVLNIPDLVRRRRLGLQVPADSWSIDRLASKNPSSPAATQCVGCSRKFHKLLIIKKTRCYLCAHFVCSRCWVRQPLDTANGRKIAVLVCPHCLGSIQNCNYAHIAASYVSGRGSGSSASTSSRVSGGDVGESFRTAQVLADADDAPEPGNAVVSYLEEVLSDEVEGESSSESESMIVPDSTRARSAANVLHHLTSVLDEGINRVMAHCFWDTDNNTKLAPDMKPDTSSALQKLQAQFARELLPLEACILSNAVTRNYSIDTSAGVPIGPIPPNEVHRLKAITEEKLLLAKGSDELSLVCELATQELSCMASLVTIVGKTLQYVLASTSPLFENGELPREHTLCQHLLMGDRPMLVQHPEADVRFCKLSLIVDFGIQFYVGFPIFSSDGLSVVGSLCCLDVRPRDLTQSQYSTLLHLTRTASNIITVKCREPRALQPLHKRE